MDLPVVDSATGEPRQKRPLRAVTLHVVRIAMFVTTLVMIRSQHLRLQVELTTSVAARIALEDVRKLFPTAASIAPNENSGVRVLDANGDSLGLAMQTSPEGDSIVGFSGPTNVLIGFDADNRVVGTEILWTRDTREHLDMILDDGRLLSNWRGLNWNELRGRLADAKRIRADSVSGATLTSFAIAESVQRRLASAQPQANSKIVRPTSLRFPTEIQLPEVVELFPAAERLAPSSTSPVETDVLDLAGQRLGRVIRTAPATDSITGYQGPSDTLIAFDETGRVLGIRLRESFDNDPYIGYVRDEAYFLSLFNGKTLAELAKLDLIEDQVEGVSGATMTSMAMAEGLVLSSRAAIKLAKEAREKANAAEAISPVPVDEDFINVTWQTWASVVLVVLSVWMGSGPRVLRHRWFRRGFQMSVIGMIGILNGDLVSQAVLVGWSQSGVPWRLAPGLVLVCAMAVVIPMSSRQQPYCRYLCPHGAVQQLLIRRIRWQLKLPRFIHRCLLAVPSLLLLAVIVIAMKRLPVSVVDLEPFDAWVIGFAGIASATIALLGVVFSAFVPMAYCRYGCPTGAVLQFLRFNGRSDQLSGRDYVGALLMLAAIVLR